MGHVLVVVLVQNETDQVRSEVAAGQNRGGEGGHQVLPIEGQPTFAAVEDDAGLEDQILAVEAQKVEGDERGLSAAALGHQRPEVAAPVDAQRDRFRHL